MVYDDLKQKRLRRNEQSFYTLGDQNLDRTFGINDDMVLTPNPYHIINFAAINYFYSLFGISIDAFTSVPSGFIASYVKNEDTYNVEKEQFYGTFWLSDTLYVLNDLKKLCAEKISLGENQEAYYYIQFVLQNKDTTLLEKALMINSYIKENNIGIFNNDISIADEKYQKVNDKNCEDNHKVLMDIVDNDNQKYEQVLNTYILPGYLQYRGYDRDNNPLQQKGQILNELDRLTELMRLLDYDKLPYYEKRDKMANIMNVLNMCSTDYSADIVYNLFKAILKCEKKVVINNVDEVASGMIKMFVPSAPDNEKFKSETRNTFKGTMSF